MEWEVVKIKQTGGNSVPFVSLGNGRLEFNAAACQIVNDEGQYKFAQILKGKEKGKTVIGVKFLTEYEENTIPIKRKKQSGKMLQGMVISNRGLIAELFGKEGSNNGMVRHGVELVAENILKIDY